MIKVITQSTEERKAETKKLFEDIKPYIDKGYSFRQAITKVKGRDHFSNPKYGMFRDLIEYARTQGYEYYDHLYSRNYKE